MSRLSGMNQEELKKFRRDLAAKREAAYKELKKTKTTSPKSVFDSKSYTINNPKVRKFKE